MIESNIKVILTGGGTGGSVSPLLAIAEAALQKKELGNFEFLWIGGKNGIEKEMVERSNINFVSVHSGKLRRYWSWRNLVDPIFIIFAIIESLFIIKRFKPGLIITAGSFVSVPVVWAGALLRIPIIVHQQDLRPGLANRLMSPFSTIITVTFKKSLKDFGQKAQWFGNPIRKSFIEVSKQTPSNSSNGSLPRLFVLGGGTGAEALNVLIEEALPKLSNFCQIFHVTGPGKNSGIQTKHRHYDSSPFLNEAEMAEEYSKADLVLSRAGLGVLTELSYLGKPTILIPMPDSHQEDNAAFFQEAKAVIVIDQCQLTPDLLSTIIKQSISDKDLLAELSGNIKKLAKNDANEKFVKAMVSVAKKPSIKVIAD